MYASEFKIEQDEADQLLEENKKIHYKTSFGFLLAHNGIRKNKMHLLIAPTHSGKSTFVRSILRDYIFNNKESKSMLWLTEENKKEFQVEFLKGVPNCDILQNLRVFSEQDWDRYEDEELIKFIEDCVDYYGIDFLVIDNITTSPLYRDRKIEHQAKIVDWLKRLSKKVSLLVVAHSNTDDFHNRFLNENDIRGYKGITNLTEFLYILQPISVGNDMHQFVHIKKHRGQNVKNKFFKLEYSKELSSFAKDYPVDFERVAAIFQERNQLSRKVR
jgi:KaiC/GvpD/RAD55 family RecA-like ATPase